MVDGERVRGKKANENERKGGRSAGEAKDQWAMIEGRESSGVMKFISYINSQPSKARKLR